MDGSKDASDIKDFLDAARVAVQMEFKQRLKNAMETLEGMEDQRRIDNFYRMRQVRALAATVVAEATQQRDAIQTNNRVRMLFSSNENSEEDNENDNNNNSNQSRKNSKPKSPKFNQNNNGNENWDIFNDERQNEEENEKENEDQKTNGNGNAKGKRGKDELTSGDEQESKDDKLKSTAKRDGRLPLTRPKRRQLGRKRAIPKNKSNEKSNTSYMSVKVGHKRKQMREPLSRMSSRKTKPSGKGGDINDSDSSAHLPQAKRRRKMKLANTISSSNSTTISSSKMKMSARATNPNSRTISSSNSRKSSVVNSFEFDRFLGINGMLIVFVLVLVVLQLPLHFFESYTQPVPQFIFCVVLILCFVWYNRCEQ